MTPSPRPGGRVLAIAAFALAMVAPLSSCRGTPTDGFELEVPASVASQVVWYEVGVFPGPGCAALEPELAGGVPAEGYVQRLAFLASDGSPPSISDLPRDQFAIGVAARAADCTVLATGCSDVDLSQVSSVDVILNAVTAPQGACTNGATCEDAECTPGSTNLGAGCSLALVGAGPLADPLGLVGTVMSAPALAATANGFLIAYREWDPNTGDARITVVPVDQEGGFGIPQQTPQVSCPEVQMSDAAGLVFSGSNGVVAVGRLGCPDDGGLASSGIDLASVDSNGVFSSPEFAPLGQAPLALSTAHAMAQSNIGTFLAYTQGDVANIATLSGTSLGVPTSFGGEARMSNAWVATSDEVVALLAQSTPSGGPPPTDDAGSDDAATASEDGGADGGPGGAGEDAGSPVTPDDGGGGAPTPSTSTLNFNMISAEDGGTAAALLAALGAPMQFPGNWGSVAALAGRVFVASDGQTSGAPVAYRAFDVGNAAPSVVGAYNPQGSGPVLYADIAFHQDHLFVAVEREGEITLDVFDNATTTPVLLREVPLDGDARIPSTSNVRDGRVAVLATDSRVIVAWTTQESLGPDDATGAFAVFACTTP
jgi:hypothetical protein